MKEARDEMNNPLKSRENTCSGSEFVVFQTNLWKNEVQGLAQVTREVAQYGVHSLPTSLIKKKKKQSKAKQSKTKQNKTKQNKTKQNKTKQNKTKQYTIPYILATRSQTLGTNCQPRADRSSTCWQSTQRNLSCSFLFRTSNIPAAWLSSSLPSERYLWTS